MMYDEQSNTAKIHHTSYLKINMVYGEHNKADCYCVHHTPYLFLKYDVFNYGELWPVIVVHHSSYLKINMTYDECNNTQKFTIHDIFADFFLVNEE